MSEYSAHKSPEQAQCMQCKLKCWDDSLPAAQPLSHRLLPAAPTTHMRLYGSTGDSRSSSTSRQPSTLMLASTDLKWGTRFSR